MRIAFIGLGQMGSPMARRLIDAGHELRTYDVDVETSRAFGPSAADTPAEAGRNADVIITMLPNGDIVRHALLSDDGALTYAPQDAIVIDTSSSEAIGTRQLAEELARRGTILIDAPVSGGVAGAVEGKLTFMVGCDDQAALDKVRPVLDAMAGKVVPVGGAGAGHAVKAINNVIAAAIIAVTSEGAVIGQRFGVEPATLIDVINSSTGRSGVSETLFKFQMLPRTFKSGFALGLMTKDVGIAEALARSQEASTPLIDATSTSWKAARDALGAGADFSRFLEHVEAASDGGPIS